MSKSNGPSDDAIKAAWSVFHQCLEYGRATMSALELIPDEYWPTEETRSAAHAIRDAYRSGAERIDHATILYGIRASGIKINFDQLFDVLRDELIPHKLTVDDPIREMRSDYERRECIRKTNALKDITNRNDFLPSDFYRAVAELDLNSAHIQTTKQPARLFLDWRTKASEPIPWLFTGAIEQRKVTLLSSAGGFGKSMLSLSLALSAALGKSLMPSFVPEGAYPVCVLSGEDNEGCVGRRLSAIERLQKLNEDEVNEAVSTRFFLRAGAPKPFMQYTRDGAMETTAFHAEITEYCKSNGIKFLVIDHARKFSGVKDENSNTDVGAFLSACQQIAEECDLSVLLLAHANKQSAVDGESRQGHVRGASAFVDESRSVFNMSRNQDETLTLRNTKLNDGRLMQPVTLRIEDCGTGSAAMREISDGPHDVLAVANTMREWLDDNGGSISENGAKRRSTDEGKKFQSYVVSKHRWCDIVKLNEALDAGIKTGILRLVKDVDARGRPRSIVCAGRDIEAFENEDVPF